MNNMDNHAFKTKQLHTKYSQTVKDMDYENLVKEKRETEFNDKFKFFSEQICEIMPPPDTILQAYKDSDYLQILKNSDIIITELKKIIANIELEQLSSLSNNLNNYQFDDNFQKVIKTETKKNIKSFLSHYKCKIKSDALRAIGEIKTKFGLTFPNQNFDVVQFEKKTEEKILAFNFVDKEREEIKEIVSFFVKEKFKELINNELKYLNDINNI